VLCRLFFPSPREPGKIHKTRGQSVETIGGKAKFENKNSKADTSKQGMHLKGIKMDSDTISNDTNGGYWTCTMHPDIHRVAAGNCPICVIKLVFKRNVIDTKKIKDRSTPL